MTTADALAIGLLVLLEGLLSFDNALALAALVRSLPEAQRKRALTYGIVGAFAFRLFALSMVTYLMQALWVKAVGGAYLIWLASVWFFAGETAGGETARILSYDKFWKVVLMVELVDIAFSIDSILAAVAVSPKLWVVVTGGILGIVMMRFAASVFIHLMEQFPGLERSAYLLVGLVGIKLTIEAIQDFYGYHVLDFNSHDSPAFLSLWILMAMAVGTGFVRSRTKG